jgi:uncharacterized membrane protein YczE
MSAIDKIDELSKKDAAKTKFVNIKPVNWKDFPKNFLIIQIGFVLFGLSLALLYRGNLGVSAWFILEVAVANLLGISLGNMVVLMGFIILSGAILLREPIGWGTIANIISIGFWLDLWITIVPNVIDNLYIQGLMLIGAIFIMGLATAIYISVDGGAGPRDSLMLGINRVTGLSIRVSRASIEIIVVIVGTLLKGPIGIGTVIFALGIGPAVQWSFKLLGIKRGLAH